MRAFLLGVGVEGKKHEVDPVVAQALLDRAADWEQRAIAGLGVAGVAREIEGPDVEGVERRLPGLGILAAVDQLEKTERAVVRLPAPGEKWVEQVVGIDLVGPAFQVERTESGLMGLARDVMVEKKRADILR